MQQAQQKGNLPLASIDIRDIGEESVAAISAALQFQHRFFLREMKGTLLPPECSLHGNEAILDLLCGPGNWCIDVSQRYPDAQVWGVDTNQILVDLALENSAHGFCEHLHFRVGDCTRVLPFANETFDVIHLQNGSSFFSFHQWPSIMFEVVRLLKPGGWLNLVDFEVGAVSQPTVDRVLAVFGQTLARMNRSTAPDGEWPLTGSTLGPRRMALQAFTEVGYHLFPVDLGGWNNQTGRRYLIWCLARPEIILFLATQTGISTTEELLLLLRQAQREVQQLDFCGIGMVLSSFGHKPLTRYATPFLLPRKLLQPSLPLSIQ